MNQTATLTLYGGGPGSGCNPEAGKCGRPVGSGSNPYKSSSVRSKIYGVLSNGEWQSTKSLQSKYGDKVDVASQLRVLAKHGKVKGWTVEYGPNNTVRLVSKETKATKEEVKATAGAHERLTAMFQSVTKTPLGTQEKNGIQCLAEKIHPDLIKGLKSYATGNAGFGAAGVYDQKKQTIVCIPNAGVGTFVHEFGHLVDYMWLKQEESKKADPALKDVANKMRSDIHTEFWNEKQKVFGDKAESKYAHGGGFETVKHTDAVSHYALQNNREWFAENWRVYFTNKDLTAKMQDRFPKTYDLIDKLVTGKLFK